MDTQDFLQSKYWRTCKENLGNKTYSVGSYFFQTTKIPLLGKYIGYIPRADLTKINYQELVRSAKEAECVFVSIDPSNHFEEIEIRPVKQEEYNVQKGEPTHMQRTLVIDLTKPEEELLAQMKQKHRYNIRVAKRHDVTFEIDDSTGSFRSFLNLYLDTLARQGYSGRGEDYIRKVWATLKDFEHNELARGKRLVTIATSKYNGKPLASWMLFLYGDTILYPYGGSSVEDRNVMAPYGLVWEIIKWGKENGYKNFDLFGIEADEKDGYTRFKLGFGGSLVKYADTVDIVINPRMYKIVKSAYKLRERVALFKKLF